MTIVANCDECDSLIDGISDVPTNERTNERANVSTINVTNADAHLILLIRFHKLLFTRATLFA